MKPPIERLLGNLGAAAGSLATLLVIQATACGLLSALRADAIGHLAMQASAASGALVIVAVFARAQVRSAPVAAAALVAALMAIEALLWGALVGVPPLPPVLQVTLVVLVYGGLTTMAIAAGFACYVLAGADPQTVAAAAVARSGRERPRRRRLDRAA